MLLTDELLSPSSLLFAASMTLVYRCPTLCPVSGIYLAALKCKEEKHSRQWTISDFVPSLSFPLSDNDGGQD